MPDVEDYSTTPASNTADFPEGQAPSTVNDGGRETQADIAKWKKRFDGAVNAGGTVNAITATFSPAHTSHVNGRTVVIRATGANTSTTPTFQLDSLAAKTIVKYGNQPLVAGDIYAAGHFMALKYDSNNDVWELLNPAAEEVGVAATEVANLAAGSGGYADAIQDAAVDWENITATSPHITSGCTSLHIASEDINVTTITTLDTLLIYVPPGATTLNYRFRAQTTYIAYARLTCPSATGSLTTFAALQDGWDTEAETLDVSAESEGWVTFSVQAYTSNNTGTYNLQGVTWYFS